MSSISEKDWKLFTTVKKKALHRYCQNVLDETIRLSNESGKSTHERYLAVWDHIQKSNKAMAQPFDGHSRSSAHLQLKIMRDMGLVDEEDVLQFEPDMIW